MYNVHIHLYCNLIKTLYKRIDIIIEINKYHIYISLVFHISFFYMFIRYRNRLLPLFLLLTIKNRLTSLWAPLQNSSVPLLPMMNIYIVKF